MQGHTNLLQIVVALRSPRRLAGSLDCRQQQRHQNANDRNDDQQLDERKSPTTSTNSVHGRLLGKKKNMTAENA
jgi:hypothetical protein